MINVTRRSEAPASLAAQKEYRNTEILQALSDDFLQKCYLTEFRFSDVSLPQIDHFVTQHEDPTKIYEWTNLYPIHDKANGIRPKITPPGGYLDPCDEQHDVEREILYSIRFDGTVSFKAADPTNRRAVNTALLLKKVHAHFQNAIAERHNEIVTTLWNWKNAIEQQDTERIVEFELLLSSLLSRKSAFTMLMRSIRYVPTQFFD